MWARAAGANHIVMYHLGLVALGGAIGAGSRHLVGLAALRLVGQGFPFGTLFVNVTGSLLMGIVAGLLAQHSSGGGQALRLFVATGILGGYTTFSAFSLEAVGLWDRGEALQATLYVGGSMLLSLAALVIGLWLARITA